MSRKPDFVLKVKCRDDSESGCVGAGWVNDDGSVSVRLDPFVSLSGDLMLTLFPVGELEDKLRRNGLR